MPIIYIEGIKTTLLTQFGCFLGFIGGKVDTALNNTRFMTSPSEFTNFLIQLPLISIFTFVRSRRDSKEKNCRDRSRQAQWTHSELFEHGIWHRCENFYVLCWQWRFSLSRKLYNIMWGQQILMVAHKMGLKRASLSMETCQMSPRAVDPFRWTIHLKQCCGGSVSGIRCFFWPLDLGFRIRDGKIRDPGWTSQIIFSRA